MKMKQSVLIGSLVLVIVVLGIGAFFVLQKTQPPSTTTPTREATDEFTGTWHGGGTTKDGYAWFVDYTFKNGTYTMKTDSSFKDEGTYQIVKRFEDNVSIQMRKQSIPFKKEYDIYISLAPDKQSITIDGMKLVKQK